MSQPPQIVAEIACNHRGELETALEMIRMAAIFCKCDWVKFQKRSARELLTPQQFDAPHPNPLHAYGMTYGEHRLALEFDLEQHRQLQAECNRVGIGYACSVWDVTSAREIASLQPEYIKVPSASNQNLPLLQYLCREFSGKVHVSLGMTTHAEEQQIVDVFERDGRHRDLFLYVCTSGYPVSFDEVCLLEIPRLREAYGQRIGGVGFSGHHLGIAVDVAAQVLGATFIERHFTLDRTWKGTDHAASLEPDGLRRLARDARAVARALTRKSTEILPVEQPHRNKLKWHP